MSNPSRSCKWEYKITSPFANDVIHFFEKLNELGDDGWELIAINDLRFCLEKPIGDFFIFKRKK